METLCVFSTVPNVKIYSPETYSEAENSLKIALSDNDFDIIRYPKGCEKSYTSRYEMIYSDDGLYAYSSNIDKASRVIITYGRITSIANEVVGALDDVAIIKLIRIFPFDFDKIRELCDGKALVYVLEEAYIHGGVGEKILAQISSCAKKTYIHAVNDFVPHGNLDELYSLCGFTKDKIIDNINKLC